MRQLDCTARHAQEVGTSKGLRLARKANMAGLLTPFVRRRQGCLVFVGSVTELLVTAIPAAADCHGSFPTFYCDVYTEADLRDAVQRGPAVLATLHAKLNLTVPLSIDALVSLDINGFNLTGAFGGNGS